MSKLTTIRYIAPESFYPEQFVLRSRPLITTKIACMCWVLVVCGSSWHGEALVFMQI
jgi:hypothetical protein